MDLIDRQEAIKALCKAGCDSGHCGVSCDDVKAIENLPSIDAVEVVRCKECRYGDTFHEFDDPEMPMKCIGHHYGGTYPDDYCSYGERKTDD